MILSVWPLHPQRAAAEPFLIESNDPEPMLGRNLDGSVEAAMKPAYRLVERVSDRCYDFVRVQLISNILPGGLSRDLSSVPGGGSDEVFSRNLRDQEARFLQRLRESYPVEGQQAELQGWRSWAAQEQAAVAIDALTDTLLQRYQLGFFARSSEAYAQDRRNWDPGSLAMAGVVGGAVLLLNGMHATVPLDELRLRIDLRPGLRLQQALRDGGTARSLASLELGYKDSPLIAAMEWGVADGQLHSESVGLKYRLRY